MSQKIPGLRLSHSLTHIFLICATSVIVYFNTINNNFVYDDTPFIVENKSIRDLNNILNYFINPKSISTKYGNFSSQIYRPLVLVSFAINYHFGGLNPFGYHLVNILFHTLNGILVYLILSFVFRNIPFSFLASLFFIIHPVQTEAVAWISSRRDVLFLFFFLCSFFSLVKYNETKKNFWFFTLIISYILSLFSKEMAISFPIIAFLYDYCFNFRQDIRTYKVSPSLIKKRINIYLPLLIITFLYIILRYYIVGQMGQEETYRSGGLYATLCTVTTVVTYYIKLLIIPTKLSVDYNFPVSYSFFEPMVILSVGILIFILIIAIRQLKYRTELSFSIFWFFLTLLPVSNIVPMVQIIAERNLYLPSIGYCIILSYVITKLYTSMKNVITKWTIIACSCCLIVWYGNRTVIRNMDWKDDLSLFLSAVKIFPQYAGTHLRLGDTYARLERFDEAIKEYKETVKLSPDEYRAYLNLGTIYMKRGLYSDAINEFNNVLKYNKKNASVYRKLGEIFSNLKEYNKAVIMINTAMNIASPIADDYINRSAAFIYLKNYGNAINDLKKAIEMNPTMPQIYNNLGGIYYFRGQYKEAIRQYEKALEVDPNFLEAYRNLEVVKKNLGNK